MLHRASIPIIFRASHAQGLRCLQVNNHSSGSMRQCHFVCKSRITGLERSCGCRGIVAGDFALAFASFNHHDLTMRSAARASHHRQAFLIDVRGYRCIGRGWGAGRVYRPKRNFIWFRAAYHIMPLQLEEIWTSSCSPPLSQM
jgi:hypothetical protein